MRIDAHHHVWDLVVRDQPWTAGLPVLRKSFDMEELHPLLDAHGIDATCLVQTVCVAEETPELLLLAAADPAISGVVGWTDLTAVDAADRLAALQAGPGRGALVGIRHQVQQEPDPRWLCRPDVRRGLEAVGAAGLAFDLLVTPPQLAAAVETVRDLPGVRFVLDHGGKPEIADGRVEPWRTAIAELGAAPNVAVKLSGLTTEADHGSWTVDQLRPYTETLLDSFGPDRVMFGSDWPVCLLAGSYDTTIAAAEALTGKLDEAERAQVFGGTAAHWYGLAT
ncbi:amidohydrolase [Streptomyces sp. NBC_00154]|uniref:amidohydrolase family protein n=1 Tax=Streptomyces sp. NBC_00154 TaxID=2975670 RepID=UPI002254A28D|nr:amidohydrolase family protein [Streptomyces sp. NBC_00154]MCX5317026.1 amidohydrolase family protein [Streptomyces sp. NBC_00154]